MLESSRAVKCPSLRYHLAGMKCFQVALNEKKFLERIFHEYETYIDDIRDVMEETFTIDQVEPKKKLNGLTREHCQISPRLSDKT